MKHRIVANVTCDKEQGLAKVKAGFSKFELQLTSDFLSKSYNDIGKIADSLDYLPDVVTVHVPFYDDGKVFPHRYIDLVRCLRSTAQTEILSKTCYLAEKLVAKYQRRIGVVVHENLCVEDAMLIMEDPTFKMALTKCLAVYPSVDFYIENDMFVEATDTKLMQAVSGLPYGNVGIVNYLNSKYSKDIQRFYTCFDTCHMTSFLTQSHLIGINMITIDEIMKNFGSTVKSVHLSNTMSFALQERHHDLGFRGEEGYLNHLLENIELYFTNDSWIVLKMQEDDDCNPINALHAKRYIEEFE